MDCNKCHKPNRPSAKFCKYCGTPIAVAATAASSNSKYKALDSLVGKDDVVRQLEEVIDNAVKISTRGKARGVEMRRDMCFAITGESGVGKNKVAEALVAALHEAGVLKSSVAKEVKAVEYEGFVDELEDNVAPLAGKALIIDDAHKHCPVDRADSLCELEKVLAHCDDWGPDPDKPVVIFVGDDDLKAFFDKNPASRARIKDLIEVPAPGVDDLVEICCDYLVNQLKYAVPTDEVRGKIGRVITYARRNHSDTFSHGHFAHRLADLIDQRYDGPIGGDLTPDMVPGKEFIPKTLDEVMAEFDKYVGIEEIKNAVRDVVTTVENARKKGGDEAAAGAVKTHYVFQGNPGTGKTTMARLFAEALSALGALPSGHLVEVTRRDLVSEYIGETPKLVSKAVRNALGGVLFIDEAHNLWMGEHDNYGKEAVTTLVKDCLDLQGKFVCILAGYTTDIMRMMKCDAGLTRRFEKFVNFRDYTGPELTMIFRNMAKGGESPVELSPEVDEQIGAFFDKVYATRTREFGNGGTVSNILKAAKNRMLVRVKEEKERGTFEPGTENTLRMADLENDGAKKSVDEILASFDDLVGMSDVKEQIQSIARRARLNQRRMAAARGKVMVDNIHIIITGNPGTGKTTVAKRLGQVFKAIGVLQTDRVVVKERKDLLNSFANSAALNMQKAVEDAMGGVLFIDEAYSLMPVDKTGTKDRDGNEAIEALMTCMSERQGQFVTVFAGYKNQMDEFIANANPGLKRRFTHSIHIPDYKVDELVEIFLRQAKSYGYTLTDAAVDLLNRKVEEMVTAKDEKFGNAGEMVKLFDITTRRQADRVVDAVTDDEIFTIDAADIPYDAPKKLSMEEILGKLDHLEGLQGVKTAVRELVDTLSIQQKRDEISGSKGSINLDHYLFLGNPGTGKTTVARIMGDIFYSLGILPSNKVIELSAKDLKAPYVGQTGPMTHAAMMRGMGGVVFIDEAYSITQGDGNVGFGQEAVAEILQVMENNKNKFICIAAGYHKEMGQWLNTNTGLKSRFTSTISFEDYNPAELTNIARNILTKKKMRLTPEAEAAMLEYFSDLVAQNNPNFANAREARNFVDRILFNQGTRLRSEMKQPDFTDDRFFIVEAADVHP